jgi:hypothetical protein
MFFKSKFFRAAAALSLIFCLGAMVLADTIRLKDGSVMKGKIIGFRDGQFVVSIGDGARARQMTFFADEVEAIEFDSPATPVKISAPPTEPKPIETGTTRPPANANTANTTANTNSNPNSNVIVVGKGDANKSNANSSTTSTLPVNSNTNTITSGGVITVPTSAPVNPNENKNSSAPANNSNSSRLKPIQLAVRVLADNTANGWTNAGWVVKKGQKIRISGRGQVSLGNGNFTKPDGIKSLADKDKLMANEATGGLIAVIGDNNNDFIFIGASREFVADRDGMLFLGVNEGNLNDNSGAFDVTIEIEPNQNL